MLLFCCFRDGQKQKKKKDIKNNILQENEDGTSPSTCLLTTPEDHAKTVHSATLRCSKEKHPPSKNEKRLLKQKSQDSIHNRDVTLHQDSSRRQFIAITDKRNTNYTEIHSREESLHPPPLTEECGSRCLMPKGSSLSITNLIETLTTSNNSLITRSICDVSDHLLSNTEVAGDGSSSSNASVTNSQFSIVTTKTSPEEIMFPGIKRSTAFHDAELLKEQIREEEESKKKQKEEAHIDQIRAKYELTLQNLKDENRLALEKATETYNLEMQKEMLKHKKENEEAISKAKQEANNTITKLNQNIVQERGKLIVDQQEKARDLEELFKVKSERLNDSLKQVEEREQVWQDERADVLKEVQRLKAEATQMVKILAMEYEEDNLSEDKKRSLSQEVYSLQLVVEMRTGEVRNLREQLARATQELEQAEFVKETLRKATARMEDLEEQLKIKNILEKQLSVEKSQMEMTVTNSNKAAQRMSQNVEELQWRIKNNFDLPIEVFPSPSNKALNLKSLTNSEENQSKEEDHHKQSTSLPFKMTDSQSRKSFFFSVSTEMLEATSTYEKIGDHFVEDGATSDFSPSSDGVAEYVIVESPEEAEAEYLQDNDYDGIDGDSLDEGLGDISSESETAESPVPNSEKVDNKKTYNNNICEQSIIISTKSPTKNNPHNPENGSPLSNPMNRPERDRIPSRISFETPL